jgi:formylglycine-generating enzyme required for sulfatase activity
MNKPSYHYAVERFFNHLERSGLRKRLELNDEDIADTVWLALQMGVEKTLSQGEQVQPQEQTIHENPIIQDSKPIELPISIYPSPSDSLPEESKKEENIEGLPFQAPAAPALPNKLQISRALRPLMRKVPSYHRKILDVEATVNCIVDALIVEQDIWLSITKPQPERWLNLELVIEENRSSFIWQETINELEEILENYGIFRTVRSWNLSSDHQNNLQLVSRKKGKHKNQRQYSYRELYHSNGRGLILLVSDCVSPIWQQETIYEWLHKWSNQSPTTIMQLFPERLWLSSELGLGYKVKLSAFNPGVPNSKLVYGEDLDVEQALNLPIITLEPESLKQWAKVVAGYGRIQTAAIVLDLEFIKQQVNKTVISQYKELSPEAIVDRFLATASPTAQKLAGLMAAVPVSLPVVHLIQKTMLPKSTPVNVAEVFLSGMVERNKNKQVNEYEFVEGVRKLLNQAMRLAETEKVLDVVSEYIADKMGLSFKSFKVLLLKLPDLSQEKKENLLPFAHVTAEVLRNLGGKYAEFAEKIETNHFQQILDHQQLFKLFTGEYVCAVKWGREASIWREGTENLSLSPQGEVQFRSRFGLAVIQNLTVQGQTLSWSFDNNETAASINFKETSEDSYFWEENQTGKLFEGWLNYPNEGRIDFRGRFVISDDFPPFEEFIFEVATIIIELELEIQRFEVATIELERKLSALGRKAPVIKRSRQQAHCFIEDLRNGVELEMVSIPEGSFLMGSPVNEPKRSSYESPQHQVTVPPFFMGKYPVTQAQWKAVAALSQVNRELNRDPSKFKGANRPVEQVSWYDAVEFCDRLSQYTGKSYSLPSEAEWEYACRARTTTPFHFGETITSELANYDATEVYGAGVKGTSRGETTPVGSFEVANTFGLYDMHGNVWEWCLDDWHDNYEGAPTDGSPWFDNKNDNFYQKQGRTVLRGGSWDYYPLNCRSAYRTCTYSRVNRNNDIGFRIVCAAGRILR